MSNIIQTFPKGSGGGHVVLDTNGTAVDQEKKLQFTGLDVSDDSTNEKTEVKAVGLNADSLDDIIQSASVQGNAVAGNGLVYSTTEQIVGKWINGFILYQKTYEATFNQKQILISLASNISVKEIKGGVFDSNGKKMIPIGYGIDSNSEVDVYKDASGLQCQNAYYSSYPNIVVTIQYTKTTDT